MFLALLRSVVRGLGFFGVRAIADSGRSGYGGLQRLIWLCAIVVGLDNQVVFCHPAAMPETYRRNGGPERTFYPEARTAAAFTHGSSTCTPRTHESTHRFWA